MLRKIILAAVIVGTGAIGFVTSQQIARSQADSPTPASPTATVQPVQGAGREAEAAFLIDYRTAVRALIGEQYQPPSQPTEQDALRDRLAIRLGYQICETLSAEEEEIARTLVRAAGELRVVSAVNNLCPQFTEVVNGYIGSSQYWQDREQDSSP